MKPTLQEKLSKLEQAIANKRALVENLEKEAVQLENIRNCHREIEEFTISTCEKYGLTLQDVANLNFIQHIRDEETRKKYNVPLRYRHPDTMQVWTGNGKPPQWFKVADADKYLIEGQVHTISIQTKLKEMRTKEKIEKALTKDQALKLKTMALGWQKIFDRGIEKTVKAQWLAELKKDTPHIRYVETFLSKELVAKLQEWETNADF